MTEENKSIGNFPNKLPKLRFTGFEGSWTSIKIENIAPLQRGFDLPSQNIVSGNIPIVYSNGILKFHNESKCTAPGLVTGRSGTIGKFTFLEDGEYWPHNTSLWVTNFFDNDPKFIYYLYHTINIKNFSTGSGVPTLNRNNIHNQICNIPAAKEQKKISSFLTSIDNRIQTQKKIIEQLETLMKASREKIFSQKLRFKDEQGNYFPDWDYFQLGEVLNVQGGFAFKSELFNKGITKVLRIGDIVKTIQLDDFKGVYSSEIPDNKYLVRKGDFVMALSGATFGKVGKISCNGKAYINQRVATFRTNYCLEFFYQLVQSKDFVSYIYSIPTASAQPNISNSDISKYETAIPSIKEQTKIANFLSSMQENIEIEKQILEKLELQKKFLLANLFV